MGLIDFIFSGRIDRFYTKIRDTALREGRRPFPMFLDYLYCGLRYGAGLQDYINYQYYLLPDKVRAEYVTTMDNHRFYQLLSPDRYKNYFSNKMAFMYHFKKFIGRDFFAPNRLVQEVLSDKTQRFEPGAGPRVRTREEALEELRTFLEKHEFFMQKPYNGLGGHEVQKVYSSEISDVSSYLDELENKMHYLDEYIVQHPSISAINSRSVNTLRIMTSAFGEESEIFYACMRFGSGEADVDNFHQGGMAVKVNLETGTLEGDAVTMKGEWLKVHPRSGVRFDGYPIPNWDHIVSMVKEAALQNEHIHAVGWDVAVTPEGSTFVEGNRRAGWVLVQTLDMRHKQGSKGRMREVLRKYKNWKRSQAKKG